MYKLDVSLKNKRLFDGCEIDEVTEGNKTRLNLLTHPREAVLVVKRNLDMIIAEVPETQRDRIEITGQMTHWVYLAVCATVTPLFKRIFYSNGKKISIEIPK